MVFLTLNQPRGARFLISGSMRGVTSVSELLIRILILEMILIHVSIVASYVEQYNMVMFW